MCFEEFSFNCNFFEENVFSRFSNSTSFISSQQIRFKRLMSVNKKHDV